MNKIKVEIEIPELNLKGEMKPLKSRELLHQLEEILIQNRLDYRLTTSGYRECGDDENLNNIFETVVCTEAFDGLPLSAQKLYAQLFEIADVDGFIFHPLATLKALNANKDDIRILSRENFIYLGNDKIEIIDIVLTDEEKEFLRGLQR